jgi:Kef-type K+ transport system membrane component KefB
MSTSEIFLIAMVLIYLVPYAIWRLGRTEYYAPLVVVQIITGIVLGPGVLGAIFPGYYAFVFNPPVVQSLNGIAWWAVMSFVWIAGIELDLGSVWRNRLDSGVAAGFALGVPLIIGSLVAVAMLQYAGWIGAHAAAWQFVLGVGMACAVTALPILVLFMEKLQLLRGPLGQRILRYASMDDLAIWGVLALVLTDWQRMGRQLTFLICFAAAAWGFRKIMLRLPGNDRWYAGLIWLALCSLGADWSGLHFMVGAFLSGAVMDSAWFDQKQLDTLRQNILLLIMPVFFLSTGLRTTWTMGGITVLLTAAALLLASVLGKLLGTWLAGIVLGWRPGESSLIGWLLQTKALIMIVFVNVLLDKGIISNATFTALLLMAIGSTMLTVPMAQPRLKRLAQPTI